jgi:SAM-dependent methyltransferase
MPTLDWLRKEFSYGYSSGEIYSLFPSLKRRNEERRIGGSLRTAFEVSIRPYLDPDATVLELGCGRGTWSRAALRYLPRGVLHTVDFQDVRPWLHPEHYPSRLICHHVHDNGFSCVPDGAFDFFFSFGALVHNNLAAIEEILRNSRPKMKEGGLAAHHYAEWDKLSAFGWERARVPLSFRDLPDDRIWWPRNSRAQMVAAARRAGWTVVCDDLKVFARDAVILLRK